MAAATTDESWPPQSARQALLSSPSGRKKYAEIRAGGVGSPTQRSFGTPSLLDRLRLARNNQDQITRQYEDEDDEETLKLELAAIEAKLKLKRLQNRAKKEDGTLSSRPASAADSSSQIQVTLSPTKRDISPVEQKSPSRVLLGIDKGVRGADISLRRAKSTTETSSKDRARHFIERKSRPSSNVSASQDTRKVKASSAVNIKSFSERMAEVRGDDQKQAERREGAFRARAKKFNLNAAEVERFKAAAEKASNIARPESPTRTTKLLDVVVEHTEQPSGTKKATNLSDTRDESEQHIGDASLFEGFSGLHLSTRVLPHSFLKRTLPSEQFTVYRIPDLLKNATSPAYEIPDEVGDFVVFGVVASKSSPLDQKVRSEEKVKTSKWEKKWDDGSQNRSKFMAITLTDLKWTIDVYLFDTALPRYYRLTPGTVIAILNPSIMPPKKGREHTGAFSLSLHDGDDTVLEIGTSKDLGYCNVVKKDGKECGQWVNGAKTEICEWHLNAQIAKTQAKRMGVNTGSNGFGGNGPRNRGPQGGFEGGLNGLLSTKNGRGFDRESGSHYYVSSSNSGISQTPIYNPNISTAKMLDMEGDPFVAEGQFSRDKEALLQKRMAKQEKERDIARKLANLGSGTGAGADYMRRKLNNDLTHQSSRTESHLRHRQTAPNSASPYLDTHAEKSTSTNLKVEIGRKRAAEDVRLSPIKKKTRFVTDRGIKEAGKESMGPGAIVTKGRHDADDGDDDDDDLDIV